jgi:RecG-like helicase
MRPSLLDPLFAALTTLPGVGPKLDKLYRHLLGRDDAPARLVDLLFHLPTGTVDRRAQPKLAEVTPGSVVTVAVTVDRHRPSPPNRPRAPYQIYASDDTGDIVLTFFHAKRDYLEKLLPVGERRYLSGVTALYDGMLQMVHPDRVVSEQELDKLPLVEPVYPLTEGLSLNQVRRAMDGALAKIPTLPEWQDESWRKRSGFPAFADALKALHRPAEPADVRPEGPAWSRLAYDELLAGQLALALVRAHQRSLPGRGSSGEGRLRARVIAALPYSLTPSQTRAVDDIVTDLARPQRMLRLLQGDVGSGKTVVALLAAATVIEAGRQAALMAPTDILVRQHLATIAPLAEKAGIRVAILTGRERGKERSDTLDRLALGEIDLLVGTHALFQEEVAFRDLALAIVDEQHRFGVHQRLARWRARAKRSTCWCSPPRRSRARWCDLLQRHGDFRTARGSLPAGSRSTPHHRAQPARPARRGPGVGRMRVSRGSARLLGVPAGRGIGDQRPRRRRGALRRPPAAFRRARRSGARPHEGQRQGPRHGALRCGRDPALGRHHRDRGRRRRAGGDRHGDRARRAFWPRPAAPVAWTDRPRQRALDLPAAQQASAR